MRCCQPAISAPAATAGYSASPLALASDASAHSTASSSKRRGVRPSRSAVTSTASASVDRAMTSASLVITLLTNRNCGLSITISAASRP